MSSQSDSPNRQWTYKQKRRPGRSSPISASPRLCASKNRGRTRLLEREELLDRRGVVRRHLQRTERGVLIDVAAMRRARIDEALGRIGRGAEIAGGAVPHLDLGPVTVGRHVDRA